MNLTNSRSRKEVGGALKIRGAVRKLEGGNPLPPQLPSDPVLFIEHDS